jgi:hypothetical protein
MYRISLVLIVSASITPMSGFADDSASRSDPREAPGYHVLFDIDAEAKAGIVNGYGAYLQWYDEFPSKPFFRYCDNFEGKGLDGRPSKTRNRKTLVPFGVDEPSGYICHDMTPEEVASGRKLIGAGGKSLFSLKSFGWSNQDGGDLLFRIAKRIPLVGSPNYKTIRLNATRYQGEWKTAEIAVPRSGSYPTEWVHFSLSTSRLGLPNGIDSMTINPGKSNEHDISLDDFE